jgi:hypothetical protein
VFCVTSKDSADQLGLPKLLATREDYQERLALILPRRLTGVTSTANPVASAVAFVSMYVGATDAKTTIRPSTVFWMSNAVAERRADDERHAYYAAVMKSEKRLKTLCEQWGVERGETWYATNTREPIRDETIRAFLDNGAMKISTAVKTTASSARYYLDPEFAALLSPDLTGDELNVAVKAWQGAHLTNIGRRRAKVKRDPASDPNRVDVTLPTGQTRSLHPGLSSHILKGVIEEFAKLKLHDPDVIFVSQPGEKVNLVDNQSLIDLGLKLDESKLLPDCVLADLEVGHEALWFVEVVASDGPVTERRKQELLTWAAPANLPCRFLTAFESRTSQVTTKCFPTLATDSFAWFLDEGESLLSWESMQVTR